MLFVQVLTILRMKQAVGVFLKVLVFDCILLLSCISLHKKSVALLKMKNITFVSAAIQHCLFLTFCVIHSCKSTQNTISDANLQPVTEKAGQKFLHNIDPLWILHQLNRRVVGLLWEP